MTLSQFGSTRLISYAIRNIIELAAILNRAAVIYVTAGQ